MRKRVGLIVVLMIILLPQAFAGESFQALFGRANAHYKAGDMEAARDVYSAMVKQGCRSARVYYNLGTCYLNLGDVGRAVLNLRKAEKLAPRDEDIEANLFIARSMVEKPVQSGMTGFVRTGISDFHRKLTFWESAVITIILYFLCAGTVVAGILVSRRRFKRRFFRVGTILGILLIAASVSVSLKIIEYEAPCTAVAVESGHAARNGPGDHFAEVYSQQAGYEMHVLRRQSGWVEVKLLNGYTGWVPESSIDMV